MTDLPDDLRELDRKLRALHFEPRASLGPELLGRLRRGDQPGRAATKSRRHFVIAAAAVLTAGSAFALAHFGVGEAVTVDRCCYDLDGGGTADDGAWIVAQRDGKVYRLEVYEDRDGSGSLTQADTVRFERVGMPTAESLISPGLTTIRHCCQDLDGGGPADDGILVVATPPDRVHSAAIYELR